MHRQTTGDEPGQNSDDEGEEIHKEQYTLVWPTANGETPNEARGP